MQHLVCGLAGAWVLVWPIVIPTIMLIVCNYLLLNVVFFQGKKSAEATTIWHMADGGRDSLTSTYCSRCLTAAMIITFDCVFLVSAVMIPYGFIAELAAYVDVAIRGNKVKYHTAAKPSSSTMLTYGTMTRKLFDDASPRPSSPQDLYWQSPLAPQLAGLRQEQHHAAP